MFDVLLNKNYHMINLMICIIIYFTEADDEARLQQKSISLLYSCGENSAKNILLGQKCRESEAYSRHDCYILWM